MERITLIKHDDWFRAVKNIYTPKYIKFPPQKFEFALDVHKVTIKELEKNPALLQELTDPASRRWQKMIKALANFLKKHDQDIQKSFETLGKTDPQRLKKIMELKRKSINYSVDSYLERAISDMDKSYDAIIKKFAKDYSNYYFEKMKFLVVGASRIGGIVLTLGAIVKSLGTNVLAWYGLARICIKLADEIRLERKDIKKINSEIEKLTKKLQADIIKNKKLQGAKAVASEVVKGVFGKELGGTYQKLETLLKALDKKRLTVWKKHRSLSIELTKLIDLFDKFEKSNQLSPDAKKRKDEVAKKLAITFQRLPEIKKELNAIEKFHSDYTKTMKKLRDQTLPKSLRVTVQILVTLAVAAKGAVGADIDEVFKNLKDAEKAGKSFDATMEALSKDTAALKAA